MFTVLLGMAFYALPLFLNPSSGVFMATGAIAVSTDGGGNFVSAAVHAPRNPDITVIDSNLRDGLLFAGSSAGLLVSKDGGKNWYQWSDLEKRVDDRTAVYDIVRNPGRPGEAYLAAFGRGAGAVYRTTDNFFTLTKIWDYETLAPYALAADGANLYLGLSDGRVLRYGFGDGAFRGIAALGSPVSDLDVRGNGAVIYAATKSRGVFGSFDGGRSFAELRGDLSRYPGAMKVSAVISDVSGVARVYAASFSGLLRSESSGNSWVVVSNVIPPSSPVSALEVRSDGRVFAASGEKLYLSDDRGETWRVTTPLGGGRKLSAIDVLPDGRTVIVGTAAE